MNRLFKKKTMRTPCEFYSRKYKGLNKIQITLWCL